jgi:ubiquinone/menaquinone biosynthesis C-methylase UbiE
VQISDRQVQQSERRASWEKQGHMEWPIQLATLFKLEQQRRIDWLSENVTGEVLEVGCSWGYILSRVKGTCGIDINPENIELARALSRDREFHVADARNLPFLTDQFDTVMLPDVLEHLAWPDVPIAVREAARVAKERVLITVPDGRKDTEDATNQKHQYLFTQERVDALIDMLPSRVSGAAYQAISGFICLRTDL